MQWVQKMRYYVNISRARGAGQERMIPLQQKRRNMRGPALLAALSMVLTAVPAALAVETAAGTPPAVTEAPYSDVPAEAWYAPFAADLKQDGAVSGYEDGTFRAKNNVTYCEAMQMVYNVLVKTGVAKSMDAVEAYAYMGTLDTYQVPKWAQMAVAYGLKNGIIDMQLVATKFAGGNTAATREDVALLLAMRLGCITTRKRMRQRQRSLRTTGAFPARDWCRLTSEKTGRCEWGQLQQLQPKKNINRAEMAVMLNKTNSILTEGVEESGTITNITVNENKYYNFTVRMTQGGTENVMATLGRCLFIPGIPHRPLH